jgi:hypothetical protein
MPSQHRKYDSLLCTAREDSASSLQVAGVVEGEGVTAQADHVAWLDLDAADALAGDEGAVAANVKKPWCRRRNPGSAVQSILNQRPR